MAPLCGPEAGRRDGFSVDRELEGTLDFSVFERSASSTSLVESWAVQLVNESIKWEHDLLMFLHKQQRTVCHHY